MYSNGVSTRRISEILKDIFITSSSKSAIPSAMNNNDSFNPLLYKWESKYPNVIYNTERKLGQLLRFYDYPSKILLGNEFTLDNKGTYGNVMEKLIKKSPTFNDMNQLNILYK